MSRPLGRLAVVVASDTSIDAVVRRMAAESRDVSYPGLAVIVDESGCLEGVVTDGDVRRAYAADVDWSRPVAEIMSRRPVTLSVEVPAEQMVAEVYRAVEGAPHLSADAVRHIIIVDDDRRVLGIRDFLDLLRDQEFRHRSVVVFGLGFVGLTLAVALANQGHFVTGVDPDVDIIDGLLRDDPLVHEPGLAEMLKAVRRRGNFVATQGLDEQIRGVYIIAVEAPLDVAGGLDCSELRAVAQSLAPRLRYGDLVLIRSTVSVGTTREVVLPILEGGSRLEAGRDFHLAYAPERTLAGRALEELRHLPQVVGGLSARCMARAATFWTTLTASVVRTPSLEAAELVKLANNTFRDVSFAFANELALIADRHNLNAFELVASANQGYSRNPIPMPSPGVGGDCLTKDPFLLAASMADAANAPILGRDGRAVNERAARYPLTVVERFAERSGRTVGELRILLIGLTFKGEPETNDVRGSTAVVAARGLCEAGAEIRGWDAVLSPEQIAACGLTPVTEIDSALDWADAILILNNHRSNPDVALAHGFDGRRQRLIFDGWSQLDPHEVESMPGCVYATMGYLSPAVLDGFGAP